MRGVWSRSSLFNKFRGLSRPIWYKCAQHCWPCNLPEELGGARERNWRRDRRCNIKSILFYVLSRESERERERQREDEELRTAWKFDGDSCDRAIKWKMLRTKKKKKKCAKPMRKRGKLKKDAKCISHRKVMIVLRDVQLDLGKNASTVPITEGHFRNIFCR